MVDLKRVLLAACIVFAGCAGQKKKPEAPARPPAAQPVPEKPRAGAELSPMKRTLLSLARREWEYFGKQVVVLDGDEESIPHVGKWEDDGETYVVRVNWYWRAVGKPRLTGNDCRQPWSAAFISWIMQEAGVPSYQFPPEDAHWAYLTRIVHTEGDPDAAFVPHSVTEYQPKPGDLLCATRGNGAVPLPGQSFRSVLLEHTKLHCDLVVERSGNTLAAIGGNVRNSVSKTLLTLDDHGFAQPTRRRPWFMVLENRL